MAITSKFIRTLRDMYGNAQSGARIWIVPQANTYPTGALELTESTTKPGKFTRDAVPDGEYKIYMDAAGGSSPTLYEENVWHGEVKISRIAVHFDETDGDRLKTTGIKNKEILPTKLDDQTKTVVSVSDPTPDYIGQPGRSAGGTNYVAIALSGTMWEVAGGGGFENPMTAQGDMITGQFGGTAQKLTKGTLGQILKIGGAFEVPTWVDPSADSGFANPMDAQGDIIYAGLGGLAQNLPIGTVGQVLKVKTAWQVPEWQDEAAYNANAIIPLQFYKLGCPQSLYVNNNGDNEDYNATKITISAVGADYITVNVIPNVPEILNPAQYEVFIYNTASGSDGQSCDYTVRAVLESVDLAQRELYLDDVTGFNNGDTIAINVHFRDTIWYPNFTPDLTDNSNGNSFAGAFVNSDDNLVALNNGVNASSVTQLMAYESDDDYLSSFTVMNSGSAVISAAGLHAGGIALFPRPIRLGGQSQFMSPCIVKATVGAIWEVAACEYNEDFSTTSVYAKFVLPDPPAGAPASGWSSPSLARKSDGGWRLFVIARTNVASSDMSGGTGHYRTWTIEEYYTDDQNLSSSPTWVWKRTVFNPATDVNVNNDVHFAHGYCDVVTYFEHEGVEFLLVAGTTWKALSGIGSNRSYGFMQFDGAKWVFDRAGATIVAPAKHLDLATGTKYDDLTYLHDHLGGYAQLLSFKGLSYIFFSSKSSTGNYYVGLAKLTSDREYRNEGDLLTKHPFSDERDVTNEAVSGTKNGANTSFTMPYPFREGSETLYVDGRRLTRNTHYSISGQAITYLTSPPLATEEFTCDFTKQ